MINKELLQKIRKQIWHHEYIWDGAWGDITIELLDSEIKEAEDYLISRNWEIVDVVIEKLVIKWSEGANLE